VGLGLMYVQGRFLLAGSAERELANAVFAEADRQARDVPELSLVVLQAAAEAADKVGDETKAEHYRKLRDAEQRRIDLEMGPSPPLMRRRTPGFWSRGLPAGLLSAHLVVHLEEQCALRDPGCCCVFRIWRLPALLGKSGRLTLDLVATTSGTWTRLGKPR
jgi:hypothetical protein